MSMVWPSATVLSLVPAATFGKVKRTPEELIDAPGPAPALVSAVSEKLALPPSKLPGAVLVSAVIPTSLNDAARLESEPPPTGGGALPFRPICTQPRCLAVVAWDPVTCANGSDVVSDDGCSTR